MKKILVVLLAGLMTLSLVACGEESNTDDKSSSTTTSSSDSSEDDKEPKINKSDNSEKITLEAVLSHSTSPVNDFEFSEDESGNSGLLLYSGSDNIIVVPENNSGLPVTKIEKYAITNTTIPKAIRFPDTVVEFEELSCALNKNLEMIVLGSGTKTIGKSAFQDCPALKEISLNEGLETISMFAFGNCESLKSITIPASVTTIETGAFLGLENELKIYGTAGSAAEEFAKTEGIKFVAQ